MVFEFFLQEGVSKLFKIIVILVVIWAIWHWLTSGSKENTNSIYSGSTSSESVQSANDDFFYKVSVTFSDSLGRRQVYTNTYQTNIVWRESKLIKRAKAEVDAMYDVKEILNTDIKDVTRQVKRATR